MKKLKIIGKNIKVERPNGNVLVDSVRMMRKLTGFSNIADKIGWTTFFKEKEGNFVIVLNDNKDDFGILKKEGFREMNPQEARRLNKFKRED